MNQDGAETIALQALAWIASDEEMAGHFAGSTGGSLGDLRESAQDPAFLAGVLQFVLMEDRWVTAFCDQAGLPYEVPMRALAALPGGRREEWP